MKFTRLPAPVYDDADAHVAANAYADANVDTYDDDLTFADVDAFAHADAETCADIHADADADDEDEE